MRLWLVWLFVLSSSWLLDGQTVSTSKVEFPFESREGLLWVSIHVPEATNGLNFLLDTGAEVSVIDLKVARELKLMLGARVGVSGVGVATEGYWCKTGSVSANGVEFPNRLLALDLGKLSRACERPVNGLIGADFFRNKVVQLDLEHRTARVLGSKSTVAGEVMPLDVRRYGMRTTASVNGQKARWFRVDTGCASPLQWVTATVSPQTCTTNVAVGLTTIGIPQTKTTVRLGNMTFTGVETGVHNSVIFDSEAGLLGNGLLTRFKSVTLDTIHGHLFLEGDFLKTR